VLALLAPPRRVPGAPGPAPKATESVVLVDFPERLEPPEPVESARPEPSRSSPTSATPLAALGQVESREEAASERPAPPADREAPPEASEAERATALERFLTPSLSPEQLGLGKHNVFLTGLPGGAEPRTGERAQGERPQSESRGANEAPGIEQSVRDALHEHDVAIGLGAGGPVVTVAEEATRSSDALTNSRARFEVEADAGGGVRAVRVLDVSEARSEWEAVAGKIHDRLRGRRLRVPPGSAGVLMTLEVASRWQLPSGHDPDTAVSVLGVPFKKASPTSKQPVRVDVLKPTFRVTEAPVDPGTSAPAHPMLPYRLELFDFFNSNFDPTDLVPRPLRVVHARVVREKVL
jgi:hypothetical protein